jgi:hypothetical protein
MHRDVPIPRPSAPRTPFTRHCSCFLLALALWTGAHRVAGIDYPDNENLAGQLRRIAEAHPALARVQPFAKSQGGSDVWLLELGSGDAAARAARPALLVVAGIEGNDLAGPAIATAWAGQLLQATDTDAKLRQLLDTATVYLLPRLNADAAQRFFARPRIESATSNRPVDDDHDGLTDEDGPDDLNGDGLITQMRVEDPEGEYIPDPAEPRLLIKADRSKGETGRWRLLSEGRDDDKDGEFNEDGPGGVNFNRNFPFNYKFFAPDAGIHQVSEVETRALADFVIARTNIAAVFTFGAADNLSQTPKGDDKSEKPEGVGDQHHGGRKPPAGIHNDDLPFYRELGKGWRDALGLKKELTAASEPGTFSDWMYFHRGRLSLATRAWSPALQAEIERVRQEATPKDEKKESEAKPDKAEKSADTKPKTEPDKRNEEERAFLKWIDANAPEAFVAWKPFDHPDLPGKKVEIGGFAPFATSNPPAKLLDELAARHGKFLTGLLGRFPRVTLRKSGAKHLGEGVYELTVQIENGGYLPTSLAQGVLTREVLPTRAVLKLEDRQILSGQRITLLGPIEGSGGSKELRWVVHARDAKTIGLEIISNLGGTVSTSFTLATP